MLGPAPPLRLDAVYPETALTRTQRYCREVGTVMSAVVAAVTEHGWYGVILFLLWRRLWVIDLLLTLGVFVIYKVPPTDRAAWVLREARRIRRRGRHAA